MNQIKSFVFLALLGIFLIHAGKTQASPGLQSAYFKDCKCGDPWTIRLDAGYTYGEFIGMKKSYAELGLFIAPKHTGKVQHFFDGRGYLIENGKGAASVGIGRRLWDVDSCRILGANIYYDFRHGNRGTFNRIGVGLECLGECVDFRVNGYFPFSKGTREGTLHIFNAFIGPFFETCQQKEFAFLGFDGEVGSSLWSDCFFDLYGAIGPYFFHHSQIAGIYGGYARINLSMGEWFSLEARVSSDNFYKTRVQGSATVTVPLYQMYSCCEANSCRDLLTQPVQRNGLIFTESCCSRFFNWEDDDDHSHRN
jgi:Inverse autotransporter, beta-domain